MPRKKTKRSFEEREKMIIKASPNVWTEGKDRERKKQTNKTHTHTKPDG
jgi:hypothetical protein